MTPEYESLGTQTSNRELPGHLSHIQLLEKEVRAQQTATDHQLNREPSRHAIGAQGTSSVTE